MSRASEGDPNLQPGHGYGHVAISGSAHVHMGDQHTHMVARPSGELRGEQAQRQALRVALYYSSMNTVKAQLESRSTASFDWIWQTNFPDWLHKGKDMFWINGKPGSGKSTLVRYLTSNCQTLQHLPAFKYYIVKRPWTILEFHFDFRAGNGLANSSQGMLRSLLLQLVEKLDIVDKFVRQRHSLAIGGEWTHNEADLLDTLCDAINKKGLSVCVFIDGLDEYTGDLRDLVWRLDDMQRRTQVKLCLASRPHPLLSRILNGCQTLTMQKYNSLTIQDYVKFAGNILDDEEFLRLSEILQSVVIEADGVILWARFIVDELVEKCISGAAAEELQLILELYPKELGEVYQRILCRLSRKQKLEAAIVLYIMTRIDSRLDYVLSMWKITMEFLDTSYRFDTSFSVRQFESRINFMLGGLLEFYDQGDGIRMVRLVHQTLETYLEFSMELNGIADGTVRSHCQTDLAFWTAETIICKANTDIGPNLHQLIYAMKKMSGCQVGENTLMNTLMAHGLSKYCPPQLKYLLYVLRKPKWWCEKSWVPPERCHEVFCVPLFRLHGVLSMLDRNSECCCGNNVSKDADPFTQPTSLTDTWYLRCLADHGRFDAFDYGLGQVAFELNDQILRDLIEYADGRRPPGHRRRDSLASIDSGVVMSVRLSQAYVLDKKFADARRRANRNEGGHLVATESPARGRTSAQPQGNNPDMSRATTGTAFKMREVWRQK